MLRSTVLRVSRVALLNQLSARYMHTTMGLLNARPFAMPAMSPTMERGGVVEWKYKVGDTFAAGDVILEVETDKAQIDVEAQDDGKLAKIVIDNGAKDIPVGETIAYLAEVDDDLSTLEFPKETKEQLQRKKEASQSSKKEPKREPADGMKVVSSDILQKADPTQTLLPSVSQLLAEKGISKDEAFEKIKGSGKNGRLLKGDVLAYFGLISQDSVVKIAKYIKSGESLDLSNIQLKKESLTDSQPKQKQDSTEKVSIKPKPIILSEQLSLKVPKDVSHEQLERSLNAFVKEAYRYTHDQPLTNTSSDYFDPIFEALVTESPSESRFKVNYQLISLDAELPSKVEEDIFDLLSGSSEKESSKKADESKPNEYILNIDIQVNERFSDSVDKSERFINYLKQLEYV